MIGPEKSEEPGQALINRHSQEVALELLRLRKHRHEIFGRAMFGEPAWEMLLLLYAVGPRQTVSHLARLVGASKSTAIRWIDYLDSQRLVQRHSHPTDKRAVVVELTQKGRNAIRLYLSETRPSDD